MIVARATGARLTEHNGSRNGLILSFIALVGSGCGYLVNLKVFAEAYRFHNYSETAFREFSLDNLLIALSAFLDLIGWQEGREVLSLEGAGSLLGLLMMIVCCCGAVYAARHIFELPFAHQILVGFFTVAFLLNWLLLSQTSVECNGSY